MGQGQSVAGKLGKYTFEENEESCLGRGSFGVVYKGRGPKPDKQHGTVAVKVALKSWMDKYAFKELEMNRRLSQLNHPNLITILAWKETATRIFIVMDYYSEGDLRGYIEKKGRLNEAKTYHIFAGISDGLSALHRMNIIHRDLKTSNVLLEHRDEKLTAKLTDFGCSRELNDGSVAMSFCGTLQNLAPECLQDRQNAGYTKESDMWSLGTILYECWMGRVAFEVPPYIYEDGERPQTSNYTPPWVQQSLDGLLRRDASERLAFEQLHMIMPTRRFVRGWPDVGGSLGLLHDVLCHLDFGMLVVLKLTNRRFYEAIDSNASLLARQRKFMLSLGPSQETLESLKHMLEVREEPENTDVSSWDDLENSIVFCAELDGYQSQNLFSALKSANELMGQIGGSIITETSVFPWTDDVSHSLPKDWVESVIAALPCIKWSKRLCTAWFLGTNDEAKYTDFLHSFVKRLPRLEHLHFVRSRNMVFDFLRDDAFLALQRISVWHIFDLGRKDEDDLFQYCFDFCRARRENKKVIHLDSFYISDESVARIIETAHACKDKLVVRLCPNSPGETVTVLSSFFGPPRETPRRTLTDAEAYVTNKFSYNITFCNL